MIIVAIIALSLVVITLLLTTLGGMPTIDTSFMTVIRMYLPYVTRGVKFINAFTHAEIVLPLAGVCLALHAFWTGYRIVMWVVKKIPMFGVSD